MQQPLHSGDNFHVGHDVIGGKGAKVAIGVAGLHTSGGAAGVIDALNLVLEAQRHTGLFKTSAERMTQLIQAPGNIPEAEIHLDGRHQVHESGRVECAGADILDEVFEDIAKITIAQALINAAGHRAQIVEVAGLLPAIKAEELYKRIETMAEIATFKDFVLAA